MGTDSDSNNGFLLISKYRGAIMGLAALWILIYHAWNPLLSENAGGIQGFFSFLELYIKKVGFCGVDIFFLLSGFGLTYAISKGSLFRFYYRRIRRIALPFLAICIVDAVFEKWSLAEFVKIVTGYYFYTQDINFFLWFIYAIVILYLLFPAYYKLFSSAKNKVLFTSGVIVLWLLLSLILRDKIRLDIFGFTNRIPVFVIGILFGHVSKTYKEIRFTKRTYIFILITFALGLYLQYLTRFLKIELIIPDGKCFLPNLITAVCVSFLFAKLLDAFERHLKAFGKAVIAVFAFLGTFTVEMYCAQDFFPALIPLLRNDGWSNLMINVTIFFLVIATAWVESVIFKYILKLADRCFDRNKTTAEVKG